MKISLIIDGTAVEVEEGTTILDAAQYMARLKDIVYKPISENQAVYDKLYAEYVTLYDYFGRGDNDVMKRLKAIKAKARA